MTNKGGRPTLYTDDLNEKAKDYVDNFASFDHSVPSIAGMAIVLGVSKSVLYEWAASERGDVSDTLERCNNLQELELVNKGLNNMHNATITKLMLSNHGYAEKSEVKANVGVHEDSLDNYA